MQCFCQAMSISIVSGKRKLRSEGESKQPVGRGSWKEAYDLSQKCRNQRHLLWTLTQQFRITGKGFQGSWRRFFYSSAYPDEELISFLAALTAQWAVLATNTGCAQTGRISSKPDSFLSSALPVGRNSAVSRSHSPYKLTPRSSSPTSFISRNCA